MVRPPRLPLALETTVLKLASLSTSEIDKVPPAVRLSAPVTLTSSVTSAKPSAPITAASLAPLIVTVMACVVPSTACTVIESVVLWPALRPCTVVSALFSV